MPTHGRWVAGLGSALLERPVAAGVLELQPVRVVLGSLGPSLPQHAARRARLFLDMDVKPHGEGAKNLFGEIW